MLALTRHATLRAKQRGVTHAMLDAFVNYADLEAPVGRGCTVLRFSRERLMDRDLRASLGRTPDRLSSLALILADDGGEIVTVLHHRRGPGGRRYRRLH
jgi:hypothetical protein